MYLGGLRVLCHTANPDRGALSALGMRELTIINRIRQTQCGHRTVSRDPASVGGDPDPQAESR